MKLPSRLWRNCVFITLFLLGLLVSPYFSFSQTTKTLITGKVTDQTGNPLEGATVQVKNGTEKTATKADGTFSINVPEKATLVISSIGYADQEAGTTNRTNFTVLLQKSTNSLDEVVVVGYGTQKKRNVTGAVSNFDAKNLDERPILRVDQALVGQMAGVTVKQTSGGLGKAFSVQVRGTGSITAGSEPLYVVDGFPLATAAPNGSGNYAQGNPLDNINPNDIESIQVLKDAAAASIYGSRAANGVVLITTKKGQNGKAKITLNSYVGYIERSRKLDMLSADEWVVRAKEMIDAQWVASSPAAGPARTASQTYDQRRVVLGLPVGAVNTSFMGDDRWNQPGHPGLNYLDWQDIAFRKGMGQNHQLSATGGNEFVKYYISGNYARQEGMVINTDFTSYSVRANIEANVSRKLKIGMNVAPSYSVNNDPGVEGKDNILHQMVSFTPVQEDTMGYYPNVGNNGQYRWSVSPNSPIGKLQNIIGETKRFRTIASLYGEYQIINGLNFKSTINFDNTDNNSKSYVPYVVASSVLTRQAAPSSGGGSTLTSGTYNSYRKQTFVNENTLSYSKTIAGAHDMNVLLGQSYNVDKIDAVTMSSVGGFRGNAITTLSDANGVTGNTNEARNVLISYFGRLQYSYRNKYMFTASMRRDGSSRFGANTRWGLFPSASIGWRVSEEDFMRKVTAINDLKIRASWGKSGNYNIGNYSTISTLGTFNYTFNGVAAVGQAPNSITNPDLAWEKSETFDAGFDLTVLKNRLSVSFDYYTRLSTDLLLNVPILAATGFTSYLSNAGSARNNGWELQVSSKNMVGKFEWSTTLNLSHNANKLVSLPGGQSQILIPSNLDINHSILRIGEPMYSIFVVKQIGILSADDIAKKAPIMAGEKEGDPKYFDANGDGSIDANDRMIVGKPNPDYVWGITNTFRYKNFDLSILIQGQNGGQLYSLLGRALGRTGQGLTDNALGTYRDRWFSADNPGAGVVSKAYSTFGRIKNTDWMYSSDYLRVRNITLGYNFGQVFKGKMIQSARAYLSLENFFGYDKYKGGFNPEATNTDVSGSSAFPEASDYGGLPIPKSFIFGVNFTF